jgi:predicted transcriptional regulator of viral defense system
MKKSAIQTAKQIFSEHNNFLSATEAIQLGIQSRTLYQMRDTGILVRESRGIYRLADGPDWSNPDLALVALRIPKGVICLISALNFHDLTTQIPRRVDVALLQSSEKPRLEYPPTRYTWLSPKSFAAGMEQHDLDGVQLRVYSIAKTITDCFKFRNKIGMDVALEALRDGLQSQRCSVGEILGFARINRVERVIAPYMEAMLGP